MKRILENLETAMAAAAFAEEGEFETARQIMKESRSRKSGRPSASNEHRPAARNELRAD